MALRSGEDSIEPTFIYILLVVFVASLIRSAFGFGEALVAVPLLAVAMPLRAAAPLAVLLSITIAAIVVVQDWRRIHLRSTLWLVGATVLGTPLGLLLITSSHQRIVKGVLAAILIGFAIYSLLGRQPLRLEHDSRPVLLSCGLIAGILGGAYGMNGPPLVIYGSLRGWSAQHFRATLQAYFLPASLIGMTGYWAAGLWTPTVTRNYLYSLPVTIPAIFLGRWINHRLESGVFIKYVYVGLAGIGALLMAQAIGGRI